MQRRSQLGWIVGEQAGVQVLEVKFCRHLALKPPLVPIQFRVFAHSLQGSGDVAFVLFSEKLEMSWKEFIIPSV
ncbi:hypothetical protein T03_13590 [Trichinella britovi]|uniref:Uncharacterized protein n=1 Tax=Trichinella britovi TaxID=45882 RepID=A0A0V1D9V7_TRIBR|nr:hypothetical protein T03_13590 [Trichinella britovi]